jgi:hypothetical protein
MTTSATGVSVVMSRSSRSANPPSRHRRRPHGDLRRAQRLGDGAHPRVDRVGDARRVAERALVEVQQDGVVLGEIRLGGALDGRAARNLRNGGDVDGGRGGLAARLEPTDQQRTLRDRVDLAVGAAQLGHQQNAAAQALGVAHRRDGDVDLLADLHEGRQVGRDHHAGHRGRLKKRGRGEGQPHLPQHVLDGLNRVGHLSRLIAGAGEAADQAVTDKLVVARAFDLRELLEPVGVGRTGAPAKDGKGGRR